MMERGMAHESNSGGVQPRVFIVNHNPAAREALRQLCASVGLAVETYPTAEAFLDALDGCRPGCLVLELCLPGMGGFGLQRELIARKVGLPIIVVTHHHDAPPRRSRFRGSWVVLWILASVPSLMSGLFDDLLPDLPEVVAGLASSLGFV